MSKKAIHYRRHSSRRQFPWLWLALVGALVLIGGGLGAAWTWSGTYPAVTPIVSGTPRLAVDRSLADEGYVKLNTPVRSKFRLSNAGDQPLHILAEPRVELVQGCWPPRAVVSLTTLQPGQETLLTMDYMMHEGMAGPHEFHVYVRTNDPVEPEKVLVVKSDWGP